MQNAQLNYLRLTSLEAAGLSSLWTYKQFGALLFFAALCPVIQREEVELEVAVGVFLNYVNRMVK